MLKNALSELTAVISDGYGQSANYDSGRFAPNKLNPKTESQGEKFLNSIEKEK